MNDELMQQLESVQAERAVRKRKYYRASRLDRYRAEMLSLRDAGASHEDIRFWLSKYKRVSVHTSTISRALERWRKQKG